MITKQKIRQKQLAFSLYFKQSNRRSSEISLKKRKREKTTYIYEFQDCLLDTLPPLTELEHFSFRELYWKKIGVRDRIFIYCYYYCF